MATSKDFCMPPLLFYCAALFLALLAPFFSLTLRSKIRTLGLHIEKFLWGNLSPEELVKFLILAALGTTIMISSWGLKTFKDGVFIDLVGRDSIGTAKQISVGIIIPLVLLYNFLVTRYKLETIFTLISGTYSALFIGVGILYSMVDGATHTIPALDIASHWLGWITYIGSESFSSLIVAHYFGYIASTTTTESAKRGYGLIIVATQIGNYLGPTGVKHSIHLLGFTKLFQAMGLLALCVPLIVKAYTRYVPARLRTSDNALKGAHNPTATPSGLLDGIRLLLKHNYLIGLASLTTIYEVVASMLDLQFKVLASNQYSGVAYVEYYASYVQTIALLGIVFGLIGTSYFLRVLGIRTCLVLYPLMLGGILAYVWSCPTLHIFFAAMVIMKTLGYTLSRPIQEIMFIPTTTAVKTQVKSVVDSICKRGAKAIAGHLLSWFPTNPVDLLTSSTYTSLGFIGLGVAVAASIGKQYESLIKDKTIIG